MSGSDGNATRPRRAYSIITLSLAAALIALARAPVAAETVTIPHNRPHAEVRRALTWAIPQERRVDLKIVLAMRHRAELERLLAAQHDPTSPYYQRWLAPGEFDARFGPAERDVDAIQDWLRSEGFVVESVNRHGRYVAVSGPLWLAERVFGVSIGGAPDGRHYGNLENPAIPARFASVVAHIEGLSNMRHYVPMFRSAQPSPPAEPPQSALEPFRLAAFIDGSGIAPALARSHPEYTDQFGFTGFGPRDFYNFYDENPLLAPSSGSPINGSGSDCIALIEDSNYLDASLSLFNSTFALPAANISRAFPSSDPGKNGDEGEALLDIEWAHAVAPGAPLKVYIGNPNLDENEPVPDGDEGDPITDALEQAVEDNSCSAISISFAECGDPASFFSGVQDPLFAQAASQGQSVFVAAGDFGAAGLVLDPASQQCVQARSRHVNEMSADPHVTSVGGTQFRASFNSGGAFIGPIVPESVWDEPASGTRQGFDGASGGGVSTVFAKPDYQTPWTATDGHRDVPDIAMLASPDLPGVCTGDDQAPLKPAAIVDCGTGGTSLATPVWAGVARLIEQLNGEQRLGNINPRLYSIAALESAVGLRDVTKGINTVGSVIGFPAKPGYDQSTGWGTPDIAKFAQAFLTASPAPTPTPVPTPSGTLMVSPNRIVFPATGTNLSHPVFRSFRIANTGKGTLTGSLDLSALPTPFSVTTATAGPFSLATNHSKNVVVQFAPTTSGHPSGTITVLSSDPKHPSFNISVSGTAVPPTIRAPRVLNFGPVTLNKSKVIAFVIKNVGKGVLTGTVDGTSPSPPFSGPPSAVAFRLHYGQSLRLRVAFSPTAKQTFDGAINILSDDPAHATFSVNLAGLGI